MKDERFFFKTKHKLIKEFYGPVHRFKGRNKYQRLYKEVKSKDDPYIKLADNWEKYWPEA